MAKRKAQHAKRSMTDAASGLQDIIESAEDMLESVNDQQGEAVDRLRKRLSKTVADARERLSNLEVPESVSEAYDATLSYVRSDPWRAVAIGAIAVIAVSLLIKATSDD